MIQLQNLTKSYRVGHSRKIVLDNVSLTLPSGASVALLGRNGAGKSTLLQMVAGTIRPDSGQVVSDGTISWPVGFGGSFHRDLTGAQNIRFIARIYGVDTESLVGFVDREALRYAYSKLLSRHAIPPRVRSVDGHPVRYIPRRRGYGGWRCCIPP